MLRHQITCLHLGVNLIPKSTSCGQVMSLFCVTVCPLLFALIHWFLNCCQHVLFHLAVLVKDTDSWFFYAWLKVQLHLSFFFPASMIASQPFNIVQNWGIVHGFHILYHFNLHAVAESSSELILLMNRRSFNLVQCQKRALWSKFNLSEDQTKQIIIN